MRASEKSTTDMLQNALRVIESFRPLATAVRENLDACPPAVVVAYEGIADMVAEAEASDATMAREATP
jgi:hypothetical protein